MAEVLVIGKKISEMGLVNEITGEEKIPTGVVGDKAVTTGQLLTYLENNGKAQWGRIEGDITNQADLQNQFSQERDTLKSYTQEQVSQQQVALQEHIDATNEVFEYARENGSALPYKEGISYEEGAVVVKDGELQQWRGGVWRSAVAEGLSDTIQTFNTPEAGVDPVNGVVDGAYFNVRSSNDESYGDEYQNVGGSAVATGRSYPSAAYVQNVAKFTAQPFKSGKTYGLNERVQLENGDIVKSIEPNNTKNPNTDMAGWELSNNALNTSFSTLNRAIKRVVADRFLERVSIKDFGAIGDGTLHTLQEWVDSGKFSGLAAIQVAMPFVTSLTQSIDWAATQYCLNNFKNIYAPKGKYVFSDAAKFPHNTTPYNMGVFAAAPRFYGDGVCTTFTRNDERPATRVLNAEGTSTTQASDTENMNEACFSVHCPYSQISDLTIESSRIGIYLGQDFLRPFTSLSSVSRSSFKRLQIRRCGTGVLMLAAGGNHYCEFNDIHFADCQIDVHQRASFWWKITQGRGDANNNRNMFSHIRSGRSRIGYWNQCGDTNTLLTWHGEQINHTSPSNPYPVPDGLPEGIPNNACLFVFDKFNQLNTVAFCNVESTNWHLYNDGANNSFTYNTIQEASVTLVSRPLKWDGRYVLRNRGIGFTDNTYLGAFPEMPAPGALYLGLGTPFGVRCVSTDIYHQPTSNLRGSYKQEFSIEVDAIPANTPTPVTIWASQPGIQASTSAMIDVDVIGRCDTAGQISSFNTKAMVNAYRTSARALSRLGISTLSASRATYENLLDLVDTNQIALTVQKNATTPQSLELVITCPFDLTGAVVFVSHKIMR